MTLAYKEADDGLVPLRNTFLLPTAKLDEQKFEFYFLLDVSGSMHGHPSEMASRALLLFLQSLPEDCYFNIFSFDEHCTQVFPQSVKYSQETLEQARSAIAGLWRYGYDDNIYVPLQKIYEAPQKAGYLTQIFTITDSCVQSCQQSFGWQKVLEMVRSKIKHSRNFSLGIGGGVNKDFILGMAENSGGLSAFVDCSEQIESKILNMLKVSLKPALLKPIRDAAASRLIPMYE